MGRIWDVDEQLGTAELTDVQSLHVEYLYLSPRPCTCLSYVDLSHSAITSLIARHDARTDVGTGACSV